MPWAVAAAAITAGTTIYATSQNRKTAKEAIAAEQQASATQNESIDRMIDEINAGVSRARDIYSGVQQETAAGPSYFREIFAQPNRLTPAQEQAREDLRRRVTESSQVAGSALRGSGRSFVEAMRAVEGDFTNNALAQNEARRDAAARVFATPYFNSAGSAASAEATRGQQVGQAIADQGVNSANSLRSVADISGSGRAANTGLIIQGLGDITGIIRDEQKRRQVEPQQTSYQPGSYTLVGPD